jgi:resuscitation-promoting factor RpfB
MGVGNVASAVPLGVGAISAGRARRPRSFLAIGGTVATALSALLGVCLVASVSMQPAGASSSPSASGLDAQAQQLETQVVQNASALHAMATTEAADRQRLAGADEQIVSDQAELQGLEAKLARAAATLRSIALNQYMQDTSAADLSVFWGTPDRVAMTATYEQLATAAESNAVTGFLQDQTAVERQQATLMAERAAAGADYSSVQHQYDTLEAAAQTEQGELSKVRDEQVELAQAQAAAAHQAQAASQQAQAAARQGPPSTVPLAALAGSNGSSSSNLGRLRLCESGGNYGDNTGNGFYGAYQFSASTWQNLGYSGLPSQASAAQQDQAAAQLAQSDGWSQWPGCSAMLGLG